MYVYMLIHTYLYVCTYIYICTHGHICKYVYVCVCIVLEKLERIGNSPFFGVVVRKELPKSARRYLRIAGVLHFETNLTLKCVMVCMRACVSNLICICLFKYTRTHTHARTYTFRHACADVCMRMTRNPSQSDFVQKKESNKRDRGNERG